MNLILKAILAISMVLACFSAGAQVESMNLRFVDGSGGLHPNKVGVAGADQAAANAISRINGGSTVVQAAPVFAVGQPVIFTSVPAGYGGFRPCTTEEALRRSGMMTLLGGVAGALVGDTSRSAGVGAGTMLLYTITGECRVAVPQGSAGTLVPQGVSGVVPGTVNKPSDCDIIGNPKLQDLKGLTEEQCAEVAKAAGKQVAPTAPTGPADNGTTGPDTDSNWQWRETDSVTSPGRCVVERVLVGVPKPAFCANMKELPRNKEEPRKNWKLRASQLPS